MQWGDLSFMSDTLDNYFSRGRTANSGNYFNLKKHIPRGFFKSHDSSIDSRYIKVKILTETLKREKSAEV